MTNIGLSDQEIVDGLRRRDCLVTRDYFYGYCRIAWHIYDKKYCLSKKSSMDFYSIAHEYYIALDRGNFRQLEGRKPGVSLKTWMINGFRFVLLDRLKACRRDSCLTGIEERSNDSDLSFDIPDNNFQEDFRNTIFEICRVVYGRDSRSALLLQMLLIDGFQGKEVAAQLGVSPSAVTQRFHKMMDQVVIPYFKRYYEVPDGAPCSEVSAEAVKGAPCETRELFSHENMERDYSKRITPEHITSLQPGEVFVFGSNLAGMHGGGAARAARLCFGAVVGNGDGPQGRSYAIPTMQGGVETIRPYVDKFIAYAIAHPHKTFLVTPIGCGIAGFYPDDIAPLFRKAVEVENIHLPQSFWKELLRE